MANYDEEDDEARRRTRGSMERIPGIPDFHLRTADEEPTSPEPIVVRRRLKSRPGELRSDDPPVLVSAPWDENTETRLAAERAGYRSERAPRQNGDAHAQPYAELPWWKSGSGLAKVLMALAGCITAAGGLAIPIINAIRQPDVANERLKKLEDRATTCEDKTKAVDGRLEAASGSLQKQSDELKSKYQELDMRYPAPKVDPHRPPKY